MLAPQQTRAVETFYDLFSDLPRIGMGPTILGKGVKAPSEPVLRALGEALSSEHSSIDVVGASNVEHLASVYRGVLTDAAADARRPLAQAEVDRLALETVLTDAFMKGRSPADLEAAETVPTNYGETGGAIFDGMKRYLKNAVRDGGTMSPAVRKVVYEWIDCGAVPAHKLAVRVAAATSGLTEAQGIELKHVWKSRLMQSGRSLAAQGFLQGTWLHGIPAFGKIVAAVTAAGLPEEMAPDVMESVLGHHMAGFVAAGFAKGGLRVDFAKMERRGQIPEGAGQRLTDLYDTATELAGIWRPRIDHASFHGLGLSEEERDAYALDAGRMRDAIDRMSPAGRSQLLNDDYMQFTDLGMPKWLAMGRAFYGHDGEISNGELIQNVYAKMVQPYLEENQARGSGDAFVIGTAPVASRLGVRLDPDAIVYRPAGPDHPAFHTLAKLVAMDPPLARAARRDLGKEVGQVESAALVDWFRKIPADIDTLARLAGRPD
ncbi:MAG: hypothetical protein FJZ01_16240 [Candidatus Sericytochromatia bacterium]|nr:hypothetical protein [Candidatus Tanganyikabacteria bacterium]